MVVRTRSAGLMWSLSLVGMAPPRQVNRIVGERKQTLAIGPCDLVHALKLSIRPPLCRPIPLAVIAIVALTAVLWRRHLLPIISVNWIFPLIGMVAIVLMIAALLLMVVGVGVVVRAGWPGEAVGARPRE